MEYIFSFLYFSIMVVFIICSVFYLQKEKGGQVGFLMMGLVLVMCVFWPFPVTLAILRHMFGGRLLNIFTNKLLENLAVGAYVAQEKRFTFRMLVVSSRGRVRKPQSVGGKLVCNTKQGDVIYFAVKLADSEEIQFFTSRILINGETVDIASAVPASKGFVIGALTNFVPSVLIEAFTYDTHPELDANIPMPQ